MVCSTEVLMRKAKISDIPVLVQFNRIFAKELGRVSPDLELNAEGIQYLLERPEIGTYLVAERDCEDGKKQIVGALMITKEFSDWKNGQFWWIQNIFVIREVRRTGVYRKMFDAVKKLADETGNVIGFRVRIRKQNHHAIRTAEAMGMKDNEYLLYELPYVPGQL